MTVASISKCVVDIHIYVQLGNLLKIVHLDELFFQL